MLKKLRFFIPISFFQIMWLPLWEDKSIKELTISGLATRAPALVIPEWSRIGKTQRKKKERKQETRAIVVSKI